MNASDGSVVWSFLAGGFLFSSPAVVNSTVYIGSYDGYVYALGTASAIAPAPKPTATPSPNPTTTPTPTPTATPPPGNTTKSTPTPTATTTPAPAPIQYQAPAQLFNTQPTTAPMPAADPNEGTFVNWIVLGGIIITTLASLIFFVQTYKNLKTTR